MFKIKHSIVLPIFLDIPLIHLILDPHVQSLILFLTQAVRLISYLIHPQPQFLAHFLRLANLISLNLNLLL